MAFEDKSILCKRCRLPFIFSASEQEYFALKQLQNEPKHCSNCRMLRRLEEAGKDSGRYSTEVECHNCRALTLVLFKPTGLKPVYCSNCMHANKKGGIA
jgi:CxxC-x17-CxxC domain-containing protein